ncbi:hypothetical protein HPB49_009257 [Dermacentor silvarum]|uniref:Uncharacterized protein n=1 Tax=Dermacentor silvarum TaxID=543639 RepID=A0ACB8DYM9_DERSI|nr:hypothetical protein HPB49_009257 [Dermacentor silvarum]
MSSPEVLASLTTDVERVLYLLTQLEPKGDINFAASLRVAHLMLKQRENKNHKMRIVFFVGSPVLAPTGELDLLARRLKREKVNVDIVNFGEYGVNMGKLSNFINILNGDATGSSHMVTVPAGNILSKVVASTPVVQGENSRRAINYDLEFEDDDPAVLLALRVSMAEQRQWQDYEARQAMADSPRDAVLAASDDTASEFLSAEEQQLLEEILFMGTEPGAFGGVAGLADPRTTSEDEQFDYDMLMSLQLDQPLPELISPIDLPDTLSAEADDDSIDRDEALQVLGQEPGSYKARPSVPRVSSAARAKARRVPPKARWPAAHGGAVESPVTAIRARHSVASRHARDNGLKSVRQALPRQSQTVLEPKMDPTRGLWNRRKQARARRDTTTPRVTSPSG